MSMGSYEPLCSGDDLTAFAREQLLQDPVVQAFQETLATPDEANIQEDDIALDALTKRCMYKI